MSWARTFRYFFIMAYLLFGGWSCPTCRDDSPAPYEPPEDIETPLEVTSRVPSGTVTDSRALIYVTCCNWLDTSTIGPGDVRVRDDAGEIAGTVGPYHEFPEDPCTGIFFRPAKPLEPDTCYEVTVMPEFLDQFGDRLDAEDVWTFCTDPSLTDYAWRDEEIFAVHGGGARFPALAMGRYRSVHARLVWLQQATSTIGEGGGPYNYWVRLFNFAGRWQDAERILEDEGAFGMPDVGINPDGFASTTATPRFVPDPLMAGAGVHSLYCARFDHVGSEVVGDVGSSDEPIEHPQVCRGTTVFKAYLAVWEMVDGDPARRGIHWTHVWNGVWRSSRLLYEAHAREMRRPHLAMNPQNDAFVVWEDEAGAERHVRGARYELGDTEDLTTWVWSGAIDTPSTPNRASDPAVAVDDDGNAFVVWTREYKVNSSVYAHRLAPGDEASLPSPVELSDGLSGWASRPHVATGPGGTAVAVWQQHDDSGTLAEHSIMAMRYVPGEGWRDRVKIRPRTWAQENPFVAIGASGDVIVIWHDYDIHVSHWRGGTTWTSPETLNTTGISTEDASRPRVAIDERGRALAVWQQLEYSPIRWTVRWATYE